MLLRRSHLALGLAATVLTACGAPAPAPETGEIGILFEPDDQEDCFTQCDPMHDFGLVFDGQSATTKAVIRNMGPGPLLLKSLDQVEGDGTKIGDSPQGAGVFTVRFSPVTLGAAEFTELEAIFEPPTNPDPVYYQSVLRLQAENTAPGQGTATITLRGEAIPASCELPQSIDFGAVAVDDSADQGFTIRNPTESTATAHVGPITSPSGDDAAFSFSRASPQGDVSIDPLSSVNVQLRFRPTEKRPYFAFMKARASAQCPLLTICLRGTGVDTAPSP